MMDTVVNIRVPFLRHTTHVVRCVSVLAASGTIRETPAHSYYPLTNFLAQQCSIFPEATPPKNSRVRPDQAKKDRAFPAESQESTDYGDKHFGRYHNRETDCLASPQFPPAILHDG